MIRFFLVMIITPLIVLGAYRATRMTERPPEGGGRGRPEREAAVAVETVAVERGTARWLHQSLGLVEPLARVPLIPRTSGLVQSVEFEPGDRIREGQLLLVLDEREARMKVVQATADLALAEGSSRQARVNAELSQAEWRRQQELKAQGLASEARAEEVAAQLKRNEAQVVVEEARVAQARSRLDEARLHLDFARMQAPADGVVESRTVEPGALVTSQSEVGALLRMDRVRIYIWVSEDLIGRFRPGLAARIEVPGPVQTGHGGSVIRTFPAADPSTRLFRVEIQVDNPDLVLRPGMFAHIEVLLEERTGVLLLPRGGLLQEERRQGVYVVTEGTAHWKPANLGVKMENSIEVTDGLAEGDRVVTLGKHLLSDGSRVKLAEEPAR